MERELKLKKAKRALAITMILLLVFTFVYWGIGSSWGNAKYQRISILGDAGEPLSALLVIPKGVSADNPAPVIITNHGAGSQGSTELAYGIEFSRRGYVVILCDLAGAGESTMNVSAVTTADIMKFWVDYAEDQDYISEIGLTGLSAAGSGLGTVLSDEVYRNKLNCGINIISSLSFKKYDFPRDINLLCVWSDSDQNDFGSPGVTLNEDGSDPREEYIKTFLNDETASYETLYGSFEDGNAFLATIYHGTHPLGYLVNSSLTKLCDFVEKAMPTGTEIAADNHVSNLFYTIGFVCCALMMAVCAQLAYTLSLCQAFYTETITKKAEYIPISAKKRALYIAIDLIVPFILMRYVGKAIGSATWLKPIFRSTYVNPIIFWLVSVAIFGLIMFYVRNWKGRKNLTAANLGTGTAEEKALPFSRIKNAFAIASITAVAAFVWSDILIKVLGFQYSMCSLGNLTRLTPERFIRAIPYVIIIIFIVLMINVSIATTRRFADTGNEKKDMIRDILYNMVISILPLTIVILLTIGWSCWSRTGWGLLSISNFRSVITVGLGFPFMMGSSAAISTYLYRKTGNTCTGIFTAAFILGFYTISFAIMAA